MDADPEVLDLSTTRTGGIVVASAAAGGAVGALAGLSESWLGRTTHTPLQAALRYGAAGAVLAPVAVLGIGYALKSRIFARLAVYRRPSPERGRPAHSMSIPAPHPGDPIDVAAVERDRTVDVPLG